MRLAVRLAFDGWIMHVTLLRRPWPIADMTHAVEGQEVRVVKL
jgi:hypothetical protein